MNLSLSKKELLMYIFGMYELLFVSYVFLCAMLTFTFALWCAV